MKVTTLELGPILNGGRRTALLPANPHLPTPSGRDRLHRRNGRIVGYVKITAAELVGPLDEVVDDLYARQAGHPSADAYRDEWCRTHWTDWTGQQAWEVTFTLEPHREAHNPMRGPWDPGADDRRRAPEPEKVNGEAIRAFSEDARAKWALDQQQREALYRALPPEEQLRLIRQDDRLRILGRDDLRVIERVGDSEVVARRLEAIWNKGTKRKAA